MIPSGRLQPMPQRHSLRAAAMAAALVLAASCSGDDDTPEVAPEPDRATTTRPDGTTTSTSPTSTTSSNPTTGETTAGGDPVSPAEQEIINRYIAFWDARFAANTGTPNPVDPALEEHATGTQLQAVIAETQANLDQGLAFQARPDPASFRRVTIVMVSGDQAVVQECFVDDGLVIQRDTGDVVNDTIATHSVRGELTRTDGAWRVSGTRLIQRWEGVAGCAQAAS